MIIYLHFSKVNIAFWILNDNETQYITIIDKHRQRRYCPLLYVYVGNVILYI